MKYQELCTCLLLSVTCVTSLHIRKGAQSRRDVLSNVGTSILVAGGASAGLTSPAVAATDDLVPVYFGVGCFWHVQHEFIEVSARM
jgi:hypothetical protein